MFSIAFRSCQVSFVRNGYSKINNQYAFAALVSRKYLSTESTINRPANVQTEHFGEWRNIYQGMLAPRIRQLKIVSFMTSGMGLCVQPMLLIKASEVGSSLAATIGVCTITGFFTFITPVLIHLMTRKYVTSIEFNEKNEEYNVSLISFFLKPKQVQFKLHEVRLPLTPKMTTTFYAKEYPLFVDPHAFEDVVHYQRILGYDKPYEFVKDVNVCKKPVVKPTDKS